MPKTSPMTKMAVVALGEPVLSASLVFRVGEEGEVIAVTDKSSCPEPQYHFPLAYNPLRPGAYCNTPDHVIFCFIPIVEGGPLALLGRDIIVGFRSH